MLHTQLTDFVSNLTDYSIWRVQIQNLDKTLFEWSLAQRKAQYNIEYHRQNLYLKPKID